MELFSEVYSCYYQVLRNILCSQNALTIDDIRNRISEEGFGESFLSIIPRLESGTWDLLKRDGDVYLSRISPAFLTPLSALEKSYLKSLVSDPRIGLFLSGEQLETLNQMLSAVAPLWKQEHFFYFDRFTDGDPYKDQTYRTHFRVLLSALKQNRYVDIDYHAPGNTRIHHYYVPAKLEYSVKNDKFRLLALKKARNGKMQLEILNLSRMQSVRLTEKIWTDSIDLNIIIQNSYYKEPLRILISNRRNALERAMLHFASYLKNTRKIDENTYECLIYYNQTMETELLIEVLSFGPMLNVIGSDRFLNSLKTRLQNQMKMEYLPSFRST